MQASFAVGLQPQMQRKAEDWFWAPDSPMGGQTQE